MLLNSLFFILYSLFFILFLSLSSFAFFFRLPVSLRHLDMGYLEQALVVCLTGSTGAGLDPFRATGRPDAC
ncbi:MAG: hypothetical protein M3498_11485 [Deinococcota bacterium]|jgi:hypothetical protein|nr:hypothetical protein [Deinococcota bacterium]